MERGTFEMLRFKSVNDFENGQIFHWIGLEPKINADLQEYPSILRKSTSFHLWTELILSNEEDAYVTSTDQGFRTHLRSFKGSNPSLYHTYLNSFIRHLRCVSTSLSLIQVAWHLKMDFSVHLQISFIYFNWSHSKKSNYWRHSTRAISLSTWVLVSVHELPHRLNFFWILIVFIQIWSNIFDLIVRLGWKSSIHTL